MQVSNLSVPAFPDPRLDCERTTKTHDIRCRDPFVMLAGDTYYLYRSRCDKIECLTSLDLEVWSKPIVVFDPPADFYGCDNFFWAPECHFYGGKFYIFTSCKSRETGTRRISVYCASDPLGPFTEITKGGITPAAWDAIDGTLRIENGVPYMVFVHEWTSMPDHIGSFVAAPLSDDFTRFTADPIHLFYASELEGATEGVTDGCYLYRTDSGKLGMIWSNFVAGEYVIAKACSDNGALDGKWSQNGLLYARGLQNGFDFDGGHGMIFRKKGGSYAVAYHSPNAPQKSDFEHLTISDLDVTGDDIRIK